MLGGFINYLQASDWKDRGHHDTTVEGKQQRHT